MKILSLNVAIWTRNRKKSDPNYWLPRARAMKRMLEDQSPDIICFQEMWFPHNLFVPKGYKKVGGTGWEHPIYVRRGIKVEGTVFRLTWSAIAIAGLDVYNVHSSWKKGWLKDTCEEMKEMFITRSKPLVICGDFNDMWVKTEVYLPMLYNARVVMGMLPEDTFANFKRPLESHGELDYFLYHDIRITNYAMLSYSFGGVRISDHRPIIMEFKSNNADL